MYKTAEERHEARLKSKKDSYARHRLQEQVKSRTRWRRRRGAAAVTAIGLSNTNSMESHGMSIVSEVDREGWDSVKPDDEAGLAEVKDVVKQAYDLHTEARDIDGPLTDQLRDGIASVVDAVDVHVRAWEELLSMMEHGVDTYFDALRYGSLVWQIKNTKFSTASNDISASPTHMQAAPSPTHMQTAPAHHISQKLKTYFGSSSLTSCTRLAPTKLRYRFSHGHTILLANQVQKAKCMVLSDVAR
ncbi:uncharacterized protein HD556DRAFT_1307908 [Suillus plorans]|uniref:Uncharacterized protein n=1 Tax=Suillus plorans TaxID=116603 RepID=A0A9P7AT64_9AGAM|nr:uncharacterized protein HD556DRAFT_1307908 [Suillus plorans]KAG1794923.1 hypothetical protein HD556DRAFT_1307908 [Suillus plorans]